MLRMLLPMQWNIGSTVIIASKSIISRRLRISELLVRYCGIFTPQIRVNAPSLQALQHCTECQ